MISANKNTDNEVKDDKGHVIRRERYQGNCSRSFYVGDVKEEDIKASFTNGELKVSLPKSNVKHAEEKKYIEIQ